MVCSGPGDGPSSPGRQEPESRQHADRDPGHHDRVEIEHQIECTEVHDQLGYLAKIFHLIRLSAFQTPLPGEEVIE